MGYEVYGLLVSADSALTRPRKKFFEKDEQGVSLEPTFTSNFIRKELEFFDEYKHCVETEIRETELQIINETHESPFDQIKEMIACFQQQFQQQFEDLHQKIDRQNEDIERMNTSFEAVNASIAEVRSKISEEIHDENRPADDREPRPEEPREPDHPDVNEQRGVDPEESDADSRSILPLPLSPMRHPALSSSPKASARKAKSLATCSSLTTMKDQTQEKSQSPKHLSNPHQYREAWSCHIVASCSRC